MTKKSKNYDTFQKLQIIQVKVQEAIVNLTGNFVKLSKIKNQNNKINYCLLSWIVNMLVYG